MSFFEELDCPVLQVPVALCSKEAWLGSLGGLAPAEVAMNVALPEIDGRLFGTVIGFKEEETRFEEIEFTLKRLKPDDSQISHVADWVRNWTLLRQVPLPRRRDLPLFSPTIRIVTAASEMALDSTRPPVP